MKSIRIGTRNSALALWQAREVARHLQNNNYLTEIVPIVSSGDKNLNQPLYSLGITGVFTRDLDVALLNDEIDIAVHSLKDVPTQITSKH
jgi:hydroxymethylbilane synthase